ncbi:MAG: sugar ABC transporter ATP-binding protein [Lachnospiraceae bacterium]|uniref:sugar ABC transporter ATP-binding protein n=1 Tax=Candidatus Merdisoma sp. JLR.KK011 TaxID=3114299 RepID=UPI0014350287|nr:sugar ABC transporter ATP-binding protein [Lachnospiraceae bacterium]MCI9251398.1 sugar ABC transporter ATP-binding protein [Lachnospiraceae bacterium]MCI9622394.1 sugar ABC transporter ATP-binding protein [Lachnospiraceae bacterium]GFI08678.1 ribose import ATP-binding protein RbsA [Lachnospiraceae bacterium]
MESTKYILEAKGIDKSFSGVTVLKGAELCIVPGELHALMGENGAGKSTLMKIIMGIYTKDAGTVVLDGRETDFKSARDALDAGISMIHQELSPIPEMTVAENVFLGREQKKFKGLPFVDKKELNRMTQELLEEFELSEFIRPDMKMKDLNIAQIQMMEIIKAISYNSKVVIMDEPTSSLSEKETETLFRIIANLKEKKIGIIYISHRMEEVFELSDRISVLRDGQFIGCVNTKEASREELINMMVGRELEGGYPRNTAEKGDVVLELKNFTRKGVFENVNLSVHAGEILGMAGLVGAGRSEVMRALVGYDRLDSGEVILEGRKVDIKHPKDAVRNHIIMASEDRKELGLVLCRSIKENVSLQNFDKLANASFINKGTERKLADDYTRQMATKMNGIEDMVSSLSGGNQQKVVLAKCLLSDPKVLIMDEPTRGIDVGAKAAIYHIMIELAKQGIAIIMISSELPELIGMSDRVMVMSGGKVTGVLEGEEAASQQEIMNLAFGGK